MSWAKIISVVFLFALSNLINGQMDTDSELFKELKTKDSILFDAAFNKCRVETLKTLFTEDFEFYHDKGGITEGREKFLNQIQENCSKRKQGEPQPAKRILVEGSLKVYPLYKNNTLYGAIQHGIHSFESLNDNKEYQKGDIAKFTHIWVLENGQWKIKRELSYDHQLQ